MKPYTTVLAGLAAAVTIVAFAVACNPTPSGTPAPSVVVVHQPHYDHDHHTGPVHGSTSRKTTRSTTTTRRSGSTTTRRSTTVTKTRR